ncbi:discoidin domain-containing protein [Paenibacillus sp. BAC0078]
MKKLILPVLLSVFLLFGYVSNIFAEDTPNAINLIPKMTSNTSPSGIASASSEWGTAHQAFSAFDGIINDRGWASVQGTPYGWISYEFPQVTIVNKYSLLPRVDNIDYKTESPKDWTFEGWNGENWVILDTQKNISGWTQGEPKIFSFTNQIAFIKYRLNISKNNGKAEFVTLGSLKMYNANPEPTSTPSPTVIPEPTKTPEPTPTITPTPEVPSGNRAILTVTLTTGDDKEFDLPMSEVNAFLDWYDSANGTEKYGINKHDNNKGPFTKRTEYVVHDKILTFEVSEYTAQ